EIKALLDQKPGFIPISALLPDLMQRSYFAATDKLLSKGDTLYAYPNIAVGVVRYNLDLFAAAQKLDASLKSVQLDEIATWDSLLEVATRVKNALNAEGNPVIYGITFPWTFAYTVEHSLSLAGEYATTEKNGFENILKARFELAKNPRLLTLFEALYKKAQSKVFHYVGDFSNNADELFAKGHCFILLDGANREPVIEHLMKKNKQSFSIGYAKIPHLTEGSMDNASYALKTGGSGLWVTRDTPGVRAFLAHITKPEIQAAWSIKTGYLPPDQETLKVYETMLKSAPLSPNQKKVAAVALFEVKNKEAGTFTHIVVPQHGEIRGKMFNELFELFLSKGPSVTAGGEALHMHTLKFLERFDRKANEKLDAFEKALTSSSKDAQKE
ncbi:MAG: ABC transporter substrate-binding protein, partial [Alphaproteobacteria bacterium]|nr:ABC transporter substrate-binding protein [Alphaproteobacteria bacterium]